MGVHMNLQAQNNSKKILIAYFSCTGNTRNVALHITDALKADIYEIQPAIPYTSADLNWRDSTSRSSRENSSPSSRPEISSAAVNMEQYDIIFVGYPIWWGQAPKILYTFIEGHNFSGKTIVPFCTSGSSPVGSSATNLQKLTPVQHGCQVLDLPPMLPVIP